MPGHHVSVFVLRVAMVVRSYDGAPLEARGYRYLVSTSAQTFDLYDVWEQISDTVLPVLSTVRLGTVWEVYGEQLRLIIGGPPPYRGDPSAYVRMAFPDALEMHFFGNYQGYVDVFYRDASMPAKIFIRYRADIPGPLYWYTTRILKDPVVVRQADWDYRRSRL